ncbi:hypothetical protein FPV67DRAFT_1515343 [Lyophyllum atratum]|nr:hypothetical protein FPV67DRAFT_1515343 [Lyophyllum atratum]
MPPLRKETSSLPAVEPARRATILGPKNHDRGLSALNNAIQTINVVKELVPLDLAKGVLSTVSGILGIIKNTIDNQDDFRDLADQCQKISLVIWRATAGTPEDEISLTIRRALSELEMSVNGIWEAVQEKTGQGLGSRVFHVTINRGTIQEWEKELDRFLTLFNTELNIGANLKLDELLASFEEFRMTTKLHADIPLPDALPAKPTMFFGRDDLVRSSVESLLNYRHVALIGTGGMGKTTISRAVLNDDAIAAKFGDRRFFVRFDDMDASLITFATFLDRIAGALGISASTANTRTLVIKALSASDVLLVLDNAETFLDAALGTGRIADSIEEFGATPNVAIMLTTRTTGLPPNLIWERLSVPALDESAACAAFTTIYIPPIEPSILSQLLSAIDFHPLSINLLAQVAMQNQWCPQELVAAWDRQKAALLNNGNSKIQSIAMMIELSLNSPSVTKLGDTVWELLRVIAFLPQGISKTQLTAMFPDTSNIESCAELLYKHSLAYYKGDFITLLAPIRLYITARYAADASVFPLFTRVLSYYVVQLNAKEVDKSLIRHEDVNIEHVVAFRLGSKDPMVRESALYLAVKFIRALDVHQRRPTALIRSVISADPFGDSQTVSCLGLVNSRRAKHGITKGVCLHDLAFLLRSVAPIDAEELYREARDILLNCHGLVARQFLEMTDLCLGTLYRSQGKFIMAERSFRSALQHRPRLYIKLHWDRRLEACICLHLGRVMTLRGTPGAVKMCLSALANFEKDDVGIFGAWMAAGYAELYQGSNQKARVYFQKALTKISEQETENYVIALMWMAEAAQRRQDISEAKNLRKQVLDILQTAPDADFPYANQVIAMIATYFAMEGNVIEAEEMMVPILTKASESVNCDVYTRRCLYLAGCIKLWGNDLHRAEDDLGSELVVNARAVRALGEVALLQKSFAAAKMRFEETKTLCDFMGVPPVHLHNDHACYMLSDRFEGWKLFLDGRLPSG